MCRNESVYGKRGRKAATNESREQTEDADEAHVCVLPQKILLPSSIPLRLLVASQYVSSNETREHPFRAHMAYKVTWRLFEGPTSARRTQILWKTDVWKITKRGNFFHVNEADPTQLLHHLGIRQARAFRVACSLSCSAVSCAWRSEWVRSRHGTRNGSDTVRPLRSQSSSTPSPVVEDSGYRLARKQDE